LVNVYKFCCYQDNNGCVLQVVLVANSLPALNDVTAMELPDIVAEAAKVCQFALC
jgi:hypothetical protein